MNVGLLGFPGAPTDFRRSGRTQLFARTSLFAAVSAAAVIPDTPGAMKQSVVLFDIAAGTRNFTVPATAVVNGRVIVPSRARVAVVGGGALPVDGHGGPGGGFSEKEIAVSPGQVIAYTVGAGATVGSNYSGGTSSFGAGPVVQATGGQRSGNAGGVGSGGTINTHGGAGGTDGSGNFGGGGASGHRYGDGHAGGPYAGGGWSTSPSGSSTHSGEVEVGGVSFVDGWGLGLAPSSAPQVSGDNVNVSGSGVSTIGNQTQASSGGYGQGGACVVQAGALVGSVYGGDGGLGGGGGGGGFGGVGAGSGLATASASTAPPGAVIVEILG